MWFGGCAVACVLSWDFGGTWVVACVVAISGYFAACLLLCSCLVTLVGCGFGGLDFGFVISLG